METVHVFAMTGSLRKRSYNRALLHAAAELLPADMSIDIFDPGALPHFNSDLSGDKKPASVQDMHTRMTAAQALLVATPEYNWSIPGVLKNAIDWASTGTVDGATRHRSTICPWPSLAAQGGWAACVRRIICARSCSTTTYMCSTGPNINSGHNRKLF